jgi:hypothetical protein
MNIRRGDKIGYKVEQDVVRYSTTTRVYVSCEYDYEDWF